MNFGPIHQRLQTLPEHSMDFSPDKLVEVSLQSQAVLPFLHTLCVLCARSSCVSPEDQWPQIESSSLLAPPAASKSTPESLHSSQQVICFGCMLRVQHRCFTASPPEKVKHFSLDHWIAFNLLQDVLQRLCKRIAILFSICMVQILQAKEWPVCTGCVLFENSKLAKTHFCSHKSMQACVEEESSCLEQQSVFPPKASTSQLALVHSSIEACIHMTGLTRPYLDSLSLRVCPALSGSG